MIFNLFYHLDQYSRVCYAYNGTASTDSTMSANPRVFIHLLTLKCGSPLDAVPSRDAMKLVERIASILQDFELRQLEIDEVEKLAT
ncbi:unnamed protein product [Heligmosomoides polygyrus]|uniref:Uncharacterized protein n=1 Tax=Heligmosomoides polygyrus TaxID=6339 RepID=A0A183FXN8_HELPZ|nr:unnamed protein product [Heligmosomoides polygyrus]